VKNLRHQGFIKGIPDYVRVAMHGRILRCPLGDNPEDCPLHAIRLLPIEKRIAWLDSKSDEEVIALFSYHVSCLDEKSVGDDGSVHENWPT